MQKTLQGSKIDNAEEEQFTRNGLASTSIEEGQWLTYKRPSVEIVKKLATEEILKLEFIQLESRGHKLISAISQSSWYTKPRAIEIIDIISETKKSLMNNLHSSQTKDKYEVNALIEKIISELPADFSVSPSALSNLWV